MRIGYILQAGVPDLRRQPRSGPAVHVYHVVRKLQRRGHTVRVLAHLGGRIWSSDDLETFIPVTVRRLDRGPLRLFERAVRRLQSELSLPYAALFESIRFAMACRQMLAGYDLLYERMGWVGYGGALASRLMAVPLILEVNGDHLSELESLGIAPTGLQRRVSVTAMNAAVRRATHVVAAGDGWRDRFLARWDVSPARVTTIENGTEIVSVLRRDQIRAFQAHNGAGRDATIIYVGGFHPWHGVSVLLRAVAAARRQNVPVRLLLIGSGAGEADLRTLATDLDVDDAVTFAGYVAGDALAGLLTQADLAASPYCGRDEFTGLKLYDYKAAGLATIASGRNGEPAPIRNGHTGLIVPPCDEAALSAAIIRLSRNPELRREMGRAARIEAEQYHSWDHTVQHLERLFQQVVTQ